MPTLNNNENFDATVQDGAVSCMNGSGTCEKIDTPLTQGRSGSDPIDTRRHLIALRVKYGADTPIGHRCSNLVEMLGNPYPPVVMIRKQMAELEALLAGNR